MVTWLAPEPTSLSSSNKAQTLRPGLSALTAIVGAGVTH